MYHPEVIVFSVIAILLVGWWAASRVPRRLRVWILMSQIVALLLVVLSIVSSGI